MIGQTISHYAPKVAYAPKLQRRSAHPPLADKILEKLGEAQLRSKIGSFVEQGGMSQNFPRVRHGGRVVEVLRIPMKRSVSGRRGL